MEACEEACEESWRTIGSIGDDGAAVRTCHAGIQYASAPVIVAGQRLGMVTAGQFLTESRIPPRLPRALPCRQRGSAWTRRR